MILIPAEIPEKQKQELILSFAESKEMLPGEMIAFVNFVMGFSAPDMPIPIEYAYEDFKKSFVGNWKTLEGFCQANQIPSSDFEERKAPFFAFQSNYMFSFFKDF